MAWKKVGEVEITVTQNGAEQDSFTASDATTVELFDYITNHGSGNIDGPNDTMSGSGYYTGIQNNIADQGSLGNVTPGTTPDSGYYSSGTIPKPSYNTTIQVNGTTEGSFTQTSDSTYDINVSPTVSEANSYTVVSAQTDRFSYSDSGSTNSAADFYDISFSVRDKNADLTVSGDISSYSKSNVYGSSPNVNVRKKLGPNIDWSVDGYQDFDTSWDLTIKEVPGTEVSTSKGNVVVSTGLNVGSVNRQ